MMKVADNEILCARAEDLVTYVYGEASRAEAKDFEQHLERCSSCRLEIAGFGGVRQAMSEWRQDALGATASPAFADDTVRAFVPVRRRSALAAFREFFTLSPAWMRAATAAVAVIFCALAAIAVAYFKRQPQTVIVEQQVKSGYSEQEVEALVATAIKKHEESQLKDGKFSPPEETTVTGINERQAQPSLERRASRGGPTQSLDNKRRQTMATRKRARPSTELASTDYLPFTASTADDELPALTDLLDDAN